MLLDEPTANLDQGTEAAVLAAIQERLAGNGTLVLVTHKMQLLALVQRVIVMVNGKIALDGPTKEVVARLQPKRTPAVQAAGTA